MKRYEPTYDPDTGAVMEESVNGGWVDSEDHEKAMSEKDAEIQEANQKLQAIKTMLYGQGYELLGWHLNGITEPTDNFFESNDWEPTQPLEKAPDSTREFDENDPLVEDWVEKYSRPGEFEDSGQREAMAYGFKIGQLKAQDGGKR